MSELQIELLGGLSLLKDGVPISGFMSNKVPALLAYLAVTRRAQTRDALAALLWGDLPDADAKNNLRQTLSNLKKFFEPYLEITRETVAFQPRAPYALDVEEFQKIGEWKSENGISRLRALVTLYRGDFLAGFYVRDAPEFEEWILMQRTRMRDLALNGLHALTEYDMAHGAYRDAIGYAARLLEMDAWREEAHRLLMLCYARTGQRSAALAQYQKCRAILKQEFGVEPSAETNALYERIRIAGETPRHNLPPQPTGFIGRTREVVEIQEKLLQPACRMVTLLGIGGIGKTRLALQVAAQMLEQGAFLDGVYFVPLSATESSEALLAAIAKALDIAAAGDLKMQLQDFVRAKELLLVLDNMEQLTEAAPLLGELLQAAPHLKLLVTSRERLNVQWEWLYPVAGLEYPSSAVPAIELGTWSALSLFVERARRVQPGFQPGDGELQDVRRIAQLVEGMPLALELAGGWAASHSTHDILGEMERNLDFLATTRRDVPARQRSLRAVLDYSYGLLIPEQRQALICMAVFVNGFTRDAAVAVTGVSVANLQALLNCALLRLTVSGTSSRYTMHELVRQYAWEKWNQASETIPLVRTRHAYYFAEFGRVRVPLLKGTAFKRARAELAPEFENLIAAWEWGLRADVTTRQEVLKTLLEALLLLSELGVQYHRALALYENAIVFLEQAADAQTSGVRHILALLRIQSAWILFRLGKYADAIALTGRALPPLAETGTTADCALAYLILAASEYGQGDFETAVRSFLTSLQLYEQSHDAWGSTGVLGNLGEVEFERGNYEQAQNYLTRALHLGRESDIRHQLPHTLNNLGTLALRQKRYLAAEHYFQEALTMGLENDDQFVSTQVMAHLAETLSSNDPGRAAELNQQAILRMEQFGDRQGLIGALALRGTLERARGEWSAAKRDFRRALALARDLNVPARYLALVLEVAQLALQEKDYARACQVYRLLGDNSVDAEIAEGRARLGSELASRSVSCDDKPITTTLEEWVAAYLSER